MLSFHWGWTFFSDFPRFCCYLFVLNSLREKSRVRYVLMISLSEFFPIFNYWKYWYENIWVFDFNIISFGSIHIYANTLSSLLTLANRLSTHEIIQQTNMDKWREHFNLCHFLEHVKYTFSCTAWRMPWHLSSASHSLWQWLFSVIVTQWFIFNIKKAITEEKKISLWESTLTLTLRKQTHVVCFLGLGFNFSV